MRYRDQKLKKLRLSIRLVPIIQENKIIFYLKKLIKHLSLKIT